MSNMDEREKGVLRQISFFLYIITLFSLIGIQLYRQFVLDQPNEEWNDIAILIVFNVIVWIGALLYLSGGLNPQRVKLPYLLIGFAGFVVLGLAFTLFKYAVLLGQTLGGQEILDAFLVVLKISALLTGFWGVLAYLGSRRIERQIQ